MVIVETGSLYHYEVSGDREEEAAAALEQALDLLSRSFIGGYGYLEEIAGTRRSISQKYGVVIKSVI